MKTLRKIHRHLGCILASMRLLFAGTGAAQMVEQQLEILTNVRVRHSVSLPFLLFAFCLGLSAVITAILRIVMALRPGGDKQAVWGCRAIGSLFPVVLLKYSQIIAIKKKPSAESQRTEVQGAQ